MPRAPVRRHGAEPEDEGIGPAGETCTTVGTPYAFEGEPPMLADWRRVPDLGQHTEEVLVGLLGYTADQLGAMAY